MSLEGRLAGAIKQWDDENHIPDDHADEYAEELAAIVRDRAVSRYSVAAVNDLLDNE